MRVLQGGWRLAFYIFFASHIPITLLVDGQVVLHRFYPQALRDVLAWYGDMAGDFLITPPYEHWFQSLITAELLLQMPFFVVAVSMFSTRPIQEQVYPSWFQTASLIYGSHVCTTMIPIFGSIWMHSEKTALEQMVLTSIYAPYLLFPLLLLCLAAADDFPLLGRVVSTVIGNYKDYIPKLE